MAKFYYPTIFYRGEKYFIAVVPDLQGCLTQGDDLTDAMFWAVDAIGTWLDGLDEKDYPAPSKVADVDLSDFPDDAFVNIVEFDTEKYFHTIRYEAHKVGLNIKQTADLLGAPYRTVQNWFNGTRQPAPWLERLIVKEIQAAAE
ncbi:MAG: type II toxin-antitoxin system HicB family antitoxin [Selenomonadaceae bacterium]|nr:type II toxin-antitoxin system HicB family antitoxin [Selenomonadaceae bacterium]